MILLQDRNAGLNFFDSSEALKFERYFVKFRNQQKIRTTFNLECFEASNDFQKPFYIKVNSESNLKDANEAKTASMIDANRFKIDISEKNIKLKKHFKSSHSDNESETSNFEKKSKKISKDKISLPIDFKHVDHVTYNENCASKLEFFNKYFNKQELVINESRCFQSKSKTCEFNCDNFET